MKYFQYDLRRDSVLSSIKGKNDVAYVTIEDINYSINLLYFYKYAAYFIIISSNECY